MHLLRIIRNKVLSCFLGNSYIVVPFLGQAYSETQQKGNIARLTDLQLKIEQRQPFIVVKLGVKELYKRRQDGLPLHKTNGFFAQFSLEASQPIEDNYGNRGLERLSCRTRGSYLHRIKVDVVICHMRLGQTRDSRR